MKILSQKNRFSGFTLVELVIAVIIGSIVLTILMSFITTSMNEISYSNKQTLILESVNRFSTSMNNYKGTFGVPSLIIDNSGTGSDVLMLQDTGGTEGLLLGVVSKGSTKLEDTNIDYETIYEKHLAVRQLTAADIAALELNPLGAYDLSFNKDKIFYDLVMKDFQATIYNTGSVIDVNLDILINYKEGVDGENWENVNNDWIYGINMNF